MEEIIEESQELEIDMNELLKKFRKFEKNSTKHFKKFKEKIKEDTEFLYDTHYSDEDDKILGKKRYRQQMDVISNTIRSIVNQYSQSPYAWDTHNDNLNKLGSSFLKTSTSVSTIKKGLKNAVSFGLGYFNNTIVEENGIVRPDLYSINDVTKVYWDPDSVEIDGSDATQCIIVDFKTKDWIKRKYGEDIINSLDRDGHPLFDVSDSYDTNCLPLITYYVKEDFGVIVYKLLNDRLIEKPNILPLNRLPIVPVYGEEYVNEGKTFYRGIVSQTKPIQKMIDFAYSQLCERLAKSPKNLWIATKEAIEGNEDYYKNADKSINQLLTFNKYDRKKELNEAPRREELSVKYDDLSGIMGNALNMMQNITGVAAIGVPDTEKEVTATEALLNVKSYTNNIRNYFDNLKESFKACGEIFFSLTGNPIKVEVINGVEDTMAKEAARQQISALLPAITDESQKKAAINSLIATFNGSNQYMSAFFAQYNNVNSLPQAVQQQIAQTQQQLQQAEQNAKMVMDENQKLQAQLLALQSSNEASIKMKAMEIESKERIAIAELQLKYNQMNAETTVKLEQEAMKQEAATEREIIKADTKASEQIVDIMTSKEGK